MCFSLRKIVRNERGLQLGSKWPIIAGATQGTTLLYDVQCAQKLQHQHNHSTDELIRSSHDSEHKVGYIQRCDSVY
jgi:hypothetical protein